MSRFHNNGKAGRVQFTPAEEAAQDAVEAAEAAEAAKPVPEKPINLTLTRDEQLKLVDLYEGNSIISAARATKMRG